VSAKRLQLLEVIRDSGWKIMKIGPGRYLATCGSSEIEHPTEDIYRDVWPYPTYYRLRQLSFNADAMNGVTFVQSREGVPWVGTRECVLTLTQAFAYLESEVDE